MNKHKLDHNIHRHKQDNSSCLPSECLPRGGAVKSEIAKRLVTCVNTRLAYDDLSKLIHPEDPTHRDIVSVVVIIIGVAITVVIFLMYVSR